MKRYDICILGGGASGIASAITIMRGNPKLRVALIEKNAELGKKILSTGNGRCNISNLSAEGVDDVCRFFKNIFIEVTSEGNNLYPYNKRAVDVRDALVFEVKKYENLDIYLNSNVFRVFQEGELFFCAFKDKTISSDKLIMALGGKSGPQYGTIGDGYKFAKNLGHNVKNVYPGLSSIETVEDISSLKGVRANCCISLLFDGKKLHSEVGELQFTEESLSGICVFNLSLFLKRGEKQDWKEDLAAHEILIDFLPNYSRKEVEDLLNRRKEISSRKLISLIDEKIENFIGEISVDTLKEFKFKIKSVDGFKKSQVTLGGVPFSEINLETFESKKVHNLFFTGEILDYAQICGGFNLNFAWLSGIKAGSHILDLYK